MSAPNFILAGRYRLEHVLGEGGKSRVWTASDLLLGRRVAIKQMLARPDLSPAEHESLRARVLREARAIAGLDHPNVVRVIDVVHERDEPWIVMELVPSRSLYDTIRQDGPMAPERAAEVGLAVLAALGAAHASGLLHRDVKPENVLLAFDGRIVLTDFGLVLMPGGQSMTTTGLVLGSPSYMAPERVRDEPIGPQADLWSLGATLYACVEGRPPFSEPSPVATLLAVAGAERPQPPVRAGVLGPALEALLQKDPAVRADAATAGRMLRAVTSTPTTALVEEAPVRAEAYPAPYQRHDTPAAAPVGPQQNTPLSVGRMVVAALLAMVAVGLVVHGKDRSAGAARTDMSAATVARQESSSPSDAPQQNPANPDSSALFTLVNTNSGKCVDVRGAVGARGTPIQQLTCSATTGQHFRLVPTDSDYVRIATDLDGLHSLDITDDTLDDRAPIRLWPYDGWQQWRAVPESDDTFHFVHRFTDKCLDVPNASDAEEVQLDQVTCNGTRAQSFRLEEV